MVKLVIKYPHDPANLQPIHLAVTSSRTPSSDSWRPAYRDTIDGKRVVWAKFPERGGIKMNLWVRDSTSERMVSTVTL